MTIREERGICSAALKELLKIVKHRIEERSVVVTVMNEEPAIWKDASMRTLARDHQLKYIGNEGMRVVTKNRCAAEQIKSDKVENVATGGEFWKSWHKSPFHSVFSGTGPHTHGAKHDPLFPGGAVRIGAARWRATATEASLCGDVHLLWLATELWAAEHGGLRWTTWPTALPNAKEASAETCAVPAT